MEDIGVSCHKKTERRDMGIPTTCDPETQEKDMLSCFNKCDPGAIGKGPMCWGQCPAGTLPCGDLLCLTPDISCSDYILKDTLDIIKSIGDVALDAVSLGTASAISGAGMFGRAIGDVSSNVNDFKFPVCDWEASTSALI
jgi:hypothetical protein